MKTKTLILVGAAIIVLSTTLAFRTLPKEKTASSNENNPISATNNEGGFALKDQDQWK